MAIGFAETFKQTRPANERVASMPQHEQLATTLEHFWQKVKEECHQNQDLAETRWVRGVS